MPQFQSAIAKLKANDFFPSIKDKPIIEFDFVVLLKSKSI